MLVVLPCETQNWIDCKNLFILLSKQVTLEGLRALIRSYEGKEGQLAYSLGCLENLCVFLEKHCSGDERTTFFTRTLPCIVRTAACLKDRVPSTGIPFISQQEAAAVVLRRNLVASLLANAVLCTFPSGDIVEAGIMPFNFDKFLAVFLSDPNSAQKQAVKLKCILSYFDRLFELEGDITGVLTLRRQVIVYDDIPSLLAWTMCEQPLCPVLVDHDHGITAAPFDTLQVDSCSSSIGGGVLGSGCLQEEVRFCVSPELLVSMIVMDHMEANEAIIVTGTEKFSECRGFGETLEYVGPYQDTATRDTSGSPVTSMVMIDATAFIQNPDRQFQDYHILRELNKAYAGFVCQQLSGDFPESECGGTVPPGPKPVLHDLVGSDHSHETPTNHLEGGVAHTTEGKDSHLEGTRGHETFTHITGGKDDHREDGDDAVGSKSQVAADLARDSTTQPFPVVAVDGFDSATAVVESSNTEQTEFVAITRQDVGGVVSEGGVFQPAPSQDVAPRCVPPASDEPCRYRAPTKGSTAASERRLYSDIPYLDPRPLPGGGTEPTVLNPLLLGTQSLRTSYAWSVASTFDEASRPVSPSELNKIALTLASSVDEFASMLAENIVAEAIASLVSSTAGDPIVASLLEEKDQLEVTRDIEPSSPSKIDAFLSTLDTAEPLPRQNDRLSVYSMRWHTAALRPVATGNWGCGTLGGNVQLKALIQWMAVSASSRPAMMYFAEQDQNLMQFPDVVSKLLVKKWTVGQLWQSIQDYSNEYLQGKKDSTMFTWLLGQ